MNLAVDHDEEDQLVDRKAEDGSGPQRAGQGGQIYTSRDFVPATCSTRSKVLLALVFLLVVVLAISGSSNVSEESISEGEAANVTTG